MRYRLFAFAALAAALVAGCGHDEPVPQPPVVDNYDSEIKIVSGADSVLEAEDGASCTLRITVDHEWKIEIPEDASWLSANPSEGDACSKKKVTLTAAANTGAARKAICKIVSGKNSATFTVQQKAAAIVLTKDEVQDYDKYYKPGEFKFDILRSDSKWSFVRSKQSEHFIVFWDIQYGEYGLYGDRVGMEKTWPTTEKNAAMRVDIDDLLAKAEQFFDTNVNKLKMAELGAGRSNLDKYKMEIYLIWQEEWLATGSGYDNKIGALWVNPSTCQPVGSTIGHEIGHSFQYQVYCDQLARGVAKNEETGFRYGYPGSNGGNGFWEQCAQWQSFQDYPWQILGGYDINVWLSHYHRHFENEWMRYASYYFQYYITWKHGIEAFGRIWRESKKPEDAIMAYNRIFNGGDWEQTRADLYDYAARAVTFDIPGVKEYGAEDYQNLYKTSLIAVGDGWHQVAYASCPGSTGFNVIRLEVPEDGKAIADFKGIPSNSLLADGDAGQYMVEEKPAGTRTTYNGTVKDSNLGWRYGFVAVDAAGDRHYGEMFRDSEGRAEYDVPAGTQYLYFIVQGCPETYKQSAWDEKELTDEQFPYMVKFTGTDIFGNINIDQDADPKDISFKYAVKYKASSGDYAQGKIDLSANGDLAKLAQAFVLQPDQIASKTQNIASGEKPSPKEGMVTFGLLQPDGKISYAYSANVGFYITKDGKVGSWGNDDPVYVEYDKDNFVLNYGHKPGTTSAGDKFTVKPCLVYRKDGKNYTAVFQMDITVE